MVMKHLNFRMAAFAACLVALVWGFRAMIFSHAPGAFSAPEEDMSFAWFVPLFSLYVVWTERRKIASSAGSPSWSGFFACLPFLFVGLLGTRGIQLRFEQIAFSGLLVALPWAFYGRRTAAAVLFPAAFLLFCVPLSTFLDVFTVNLRLFATSSAYGILKGIGAQVVRQGTIIMSGDGGFSVDVAQPCSGLRSIFALMALTAGYAYFTQRKWSSRAVLFSLSIPLAVLGNIARLVSICVVGMYASRDFATGFYHDYSGYVVFAVAILAMVAAGEVVSRLFHDGVAPGEEAGTKANEPTPPMPCRGARLVPTLTLCLVVAVMVFQSATPEPGYCEMRKVEFPEVEGLQAVDVPSDEVERGGLPADTTVKKKAYMAGERVCFTVTAVTNGRSKRSIHRPELCLPAQGFIMRRPRDVVAGGRRWRVLDLQAAKGGAMRFAYTFRNQDGFSTSSHAMRILRDTWDRTFHNRIDRWTMITVYAPMSGDDESFRRILETMDMRK